VVKEADACLEVAVAEGGKATLSNFCQYLDVAILKASPHLQVVHSLQYDHITNRLSSGFPGVFLKENLRDKQGELVQLTWK
jgi:hypothetical protein